MSDRQTVFALNELIMATRSLADLLHETATHLHEDSDLSVAERAVMLELRKSGALAVPELARRRDVTRQSTQVTVNPLLKRGLLEKRPNPAHRRSSLIGLTETGTALIRKAMRKEGDLLAELARDLDAHEVREARDVLARLATGVERAVAPVTADHPRRARTAEA